MTAATTRRRHILRLLRAPEPFLAEHLSAGRPLAPQILAWFLPAMLVRPAAVLVSSLILEAPFTAVVLATGSFTLQLGVWLTVGLVLPALARQFQADLRERDGVLVVGFASVPLWLAGALFVVPETAALPFWWSRSLVFLLALYGLFIAYRALGVLGLRADARWPMVAALAATYGAVYLVLFVLLGVSSHAVLFVAGARS